MQANEILYFIFAAIIAIPLTATICQWRIARNKKISSGTILAGALTASLIALIWSPIFIAGKAAFTYEFWINPKEGGKSPLLWFCIWTVTSLATIIPACAVVVFHRKHKK
ncbi:MAG TPA: hypothetical protein VFV23_06950 [Verrucomicrobiae bacterium]|nr:hypothetical protein [Verrucomicrobiae bacterium]